MYNIFIRFMIIFCFISTLLHAEHVSPDRAKSTAAQWLINQMPNRSLSKLKMLTQAHNIYEEKIDDLTLLYIVSFPEIIVSFPCASAVERIVERI